MGNLDDVTRIFDNKLIHWKGDGVYVHLTNAPYDWMKGWYRIEDLETIIFNLKKKNTIVYITEKDLEVVGDE